MNNPAEFTKKVLNIKLRDRPKCQSTFVASFLKTKKTGTSE
jgi:hypothetical protein